MNSKSYVLLGRNCSLSIPCGFNTALDSLNGSDGFRLEGSAGSSVSDAGDVNGDGLDDVIAGANWADPSGLQDAGASYVIYGKSGGFPTSLNVNSLNYLTGRQYIGVSTGDESGQSVSDAGDINGDQIGDLLFRSVACE